jgi:hypothetical protein
MAASNQIVLENQRPGTPESEWGLTNGQASDTIEGFATDLSVNHGGTVDFKINTPSTDYRIEIYRLGYYNGDGARRIATLEHQSGEGANQPAPLVDQSTGLVDAGNWHVTDSWSVPADAVSGVYLAKLVRQDGTEGENYIPFVVRDDGGTSDIVFKTSDTTWQAYNAWGGASLYTGQQAVSYNRPIEVDAQPGAETAAGPWDFVFGAEYPAIRWLEQNGYDVSYLTSVDTARSGSELLDHRAILSVGHDEYWSAEQFNNVMTARDAGVNLAFWSGNEAYWKTEWKDSIDGSGTPFRTMVTYKTTFTGAPNPDGVWTGLRRDPAGDGVAENSLSGTMYMVDWDHSNPINNITIPSAYSQLRIWKNTDIANLQPGETYTTAGPYLGYEWDVDANNGFRPAGLIDLSKTTVSSNAINDPSAGFYALPDPPGIATHNLTLYRAPSGALVFSAGSVFWSWGLDDNHAAGPDGFGAGAPADANVQQAMVNLFADMGIQPETLKASLVLATQSLDHAAPQSSIVTNTTDVFQAGQTLTISGTATDSGGGIVAGIEVSTDAGASWHPASGTSNWTYDWTPPASGSYTILSRATDDSVNTERPSLGDLNISDFHQNFSVAQGWYTNDTRRLLADIDGDGKVDYVGFGALSTFAVRGSAGNPADAAPQFSPGGFDAIIEDLTAGQGYDQTRLRAVEYVGNFTSSPSSHFGTFWAQGSDGVRFYVATGAQADVDAFGQAFNKPIYESTSRSYADFSTPQGWSEHYNVDAGFIDKSSAPGRGDAFASLLGFGEAGLLVGPQAFSPAATASQVYVAAGSDGLGNAAGWDSTIDVRAVRDYNGKEIDLNADGIMDVVGMGQDGLVYALGQYTNGIYSLGALHVPDINPAGSGSDFGRAQGWTNADTVRYIADVNGDGHEDIVGFGQSGVFLSLGAAPNADGSGAFGQAHLAFDDFGILNGWSTTDNLRLLGDVNGDHLLDLVGFGLDNTFVATAAIDPTTSELTWSITSTLHAYGYNEGFRNDINFRGLADVDGNGTADLVVSGASNTQVITHLS